MSLGEFIYQSPSIIGDKVKIFVSLDDASIDEMYEFVQVLQGEIFLQIKKENTPLDTVFKVGVICTNLTLNQISKKSGKKRLDFITRLK